MMNLVKVIELERGMVVASDWEKCETESHNLVNGYNVSIPQNE
jgi:hypothetical protein